MAMLSRRGVVESKGARATVNGDVPLEAAEVIRLAKSVVGRQATKELQGPPVGQAPAEVELVDTDNELFRLTSFPAYAGQYRSDQWGNLMLTFKVPRANAYDAMRAVNAAGWMLRLDVMIPLDLAVADTALAGMDDD